MAKVFVSMFNAVRNPNNYCTMPPFYESFLQGLKEQGNDILCFFHKNFVRDFSEEMPSFLKEKLIEFDADIYIFFNNHFWDISDLTDKPIIIYEVDSPLFYKNLDKVKANPTRYRYITIQKGAVKVIQDTFSIEEKYVCYVPPFTEVRADKSIEPDTNISFVGSNWGADGCAFVTDFMAKNVSVEEAKLAKQAYEMYAKNPFTSTEELYDRYENISEIKNKLILNNDGNVSQRISGIKRLHHLEAISDLGLELHGPTWLTTCTRYFPGVAFSYNSEPVFSLEDNQRLYNRSKIGFNINHIQAKTGFSWRVCEVMASNACLVGERKPDMQELFKGINLPTYTNAYEAREVCKKILESEDTRKEIVLASNDIIDRQFRFKNAMVIMEQFLGMTIHEEKTGNIEFVYEPVNQPAPAVNPAVVASNATSQQQNVTVTPIPNKKIFIGNRALRKIHHLLGIYLKKKGCI